MLLWAIRNERIDRLLLNWLLEGFEFDYFCIDINFGVMRSEVKDFKYGLLSYVKVVFVNCMKLGEICWYVECANLVTFTNFWSK
jgi:hypothetical protein